MAGTGQVEQITVQAGGSGYSSAPTVTCSAPGAGGTPATAAAFVNPAGAVIACVVLNPGSGYAAPPTVSFTGGGGSGAQATATLGLASYATVTDFRSYLPEVTMTVPGASNAEIQAILDTATGFINDSADGLGFAFAGYTVEARTLPITPQAYLILPPHLPGSVSQVQLGGQTLTAGIDYAIVPALNGRHEALSRLALATVPTWWQPGQFDPLWQGMALPEGYQGWQVAPSSVTSLYSYYAIIAAWGYGPPPPAIVGICKEIAVNIWQSRKAGRFSRIVGVSGGSGVGYELAFTPTQQSVIRGVRNQWSEETIPL